MVNYIIFLAYIILYGHLQLMSICNIIYWNILELLKEFNTFRGKVKFYLRNPIVFIEFDVKSFELLKECLTFQWQVKFYLRNPKVFVEFDMKYRCY